MELLYPLDHLNFLDRRENLSNSKHKSLKIRQPKVQFYKAIEHHYEKVNTNSIVTITILIAIFIVKRTRTVEIDKKVLLLKGDDITKKNHMKGNYCSVSRAHDQSR
jgi:hypothetical protein